MVGKTLYILPEARNPGTIVRFREGYRPKGNRPTTRE